MRNVTVIIPAHNEEESIGQVIRQISQERVVGEIIVVANCCTDNTKMISLQEGAKVVVCNKKGKGYAMEAGIKKAQNEVVAFLDADIDGYDKKIVEKLTSPISKRNIDFVKSTFTRNSGGSVTELVAKPLLKELFPEMYEFSEPLSGMIAAKKSILKKSHITNDYGVDIGILIDMYKMGKSIEEVHIGAIRNLSSVDKTMETRIKMSTEVISAIMRRIEYIEDKSTGDLFNIIDISAV